MATTGRPTDYDATTTPIRARDYIKAPRSETVKIPTIEGLAVFLEVGRATLYRWATEHEEFRDILEELMTHQGQLLIENGLSGSYNATITKLMMTKHGYVDRQELSGVDGAPLYDQQERTRSKAAVSDLLTKPSREGGKE